MFTDPALRSEFNIQPSDETTSAAVGQRQSRRARRRRPNTNVQAMMAYELMTKGLSIGFWIESRDMRGFDTPPRPRRVPVQQPGARRTSCRQMRKDLWISAADARRRSSRPRQYGDDRQVVLGLHHHRPRLGDGADDRRRRGSDPPVGRPTDADKYSEIMDQDVCQHWQVSSVAFLGGTVQGNRQWGRVGTHDARGHPPHARRHARPGVRPGDGRAEGRDRPRARTASSPTAGHVYATALYLSGLDPDALRAQGKGKNASPAMRFIKR